MWREEEQQQQEEGKKVSQTVETGSGLPSISLSRSISLISMFSLHSIGNPYHATRGRLVLHSSVLRTIRKLSCESFERQTQQVMITSSLVPEPHSWSSTVRLFFPCSCKWRSTCGGREAKAAPFFSCPFGGK